MLPLATRATAMGRALVGVAMAMGIATATVTAMAIATKQAACSFCSFLTRVAGNATPLCLAVGLQQRG